MAAGGTSAAPLGVATASLDEIPVAVTRLSDRVALFHTADGQEPTMIVAIQSERGIVVVDTERSPTFTAAIREAVEAEMSGEIRYLINTHGHGDHVAGNQVFADATIIAHENAVADMQQAGTSVQRWLQQLQPAIEVWRTQYETLEPGSEEAVALAARIAYHEQWLAGLGPEEFELTLPDLTFNDRLTLDLGDLALELIWFGRAHTGGDILVYCPEESLLLVGDLFYSEGFPYVDSERVPYLGRWRETLTEIMSREEGINRIVTGHEDELPLSHLEAIAEFVAEQEALFEGRKSALFAFRDLRETEGVEVALSKLKQMNAQPDTYYVLHPELDTYAYRLMLAEELDDALMIFTVLADMFPESDVAYDSLGEVYVRLGKTEAAIAAFERSLELNPENRNAAERLRVLKEGGGV
jgi:glyoxylase-like metal-dependent hydrolase (beta-lactamase superfamily II)